jgi:hypothetical protein
MGYDGFISSELGRSMNVQLTGNPATTRPSHRKVEELNTLSSMSSGTVAPKPMAARLALAVQDEQKWLATGLFYLLAGFIIANSGWATQQLGYPLMVIGLLLLPVPVLIKSRAAHEAKQTQAVLALGKAAGTKRVGRGLVYELHSKDYSSAG